MKKPSWCNLTEAEWAALSPDGWAVLPVCAGAGGPLDYFYDGPMPSAVQQDVAASAYMRDYPIDATAPVGLKSPDSVLFESGQLHFSTELLSLPSIGNFRWAFGVSYQGDSEVDDILGPRWAYPQVEHLEPGLADYRHEVIADRPLSYWPLDERPVGHPPLNPATAHDVRGLATGQYVGPLTFGASGIHDGGWAVEFAGGSVAIPSTAEFDLRADRHEFTVEAWVQAWPGQAIGGTVVAKGRGGSAGVQYAISIVREVRDTGIDAPVTAIVAEGVIGGEHVRADLADDGAAWTHLALVNRCADRDGDNGFKFNLFVNGRPAGPWQSSGTVADGSPVRIGAGTDPLGNPEDPFAGRIDAVAIYDTALPDARVAQHFQVGNGTGDPLSFIRKVTGQQTVQAFDRVAKDLYTSAGALLRRIAPSETGPDQYELRAADGSRTVFHGFAPAVNTPGRLVSITDPFGNAQYYQWQRSARTPVPLYQLTEVTDPYGRVIRYRYYDAAGDYLLREIEDFVGRSDADQTPGRKLNFQYDAEGRLLAVVLPSVTRAADGEGYPDGTAYAFKYDSLGRLERVYFPNQVDGHVVARAINDFEVLYDSATPRLTATYDGSGRVQQETVGDGVWRYRYLTVDTVDSTPLWACGERARRRTEVTDPNDNVVIHDFNGQRMPVAIRVLANRAKLTAPDPQPGAGRPDLPIGLYYTRIAYNRGGQPRLVILPEGNSVEYRYESGRYLDAAGKEFLHSLRAGLLVKETRRFDNGVDPELFRPSGGLERLEKYYVYEPVFNRLCGATDFLGNITRYDYDYQEATADAVFNAVKDSLFPGQPADPTDSTDPNSTTAKRAKFNALLTFVDDRMTALPGQPTSYKSFDCAMGDLNGDARSDQITGALVRVRYPFGQSEAFTYGPQGQVTTHTAPDGVITAVVRYDGQDPDGDGFPENNVMPPQSGWVSAVHRDVTVTAAKTLTGMTAFVRVVDRTVTGPECDLTVTNSKYDQLGNPLEIIDPTGGVTSTARDELGTPYRATAPGYGFLQEFYYDANRNLTRVDVEDRRVLQLSGGGFTPVMVTPTTAQVPMDEGRGPGGTIRDGWFVTTAEYDLLDRVRFERVEATGSDPAELVTEHVYDANGNLVRVKRPAGNLVEQDYDERNLLIARRVGRNDLLGQLGSVTAFGYDANGNLRHVVGPPRTGGAVRTSATLRIAHAFGGDAPLLHTGDWLTEHLYDGYDRIFQSVDALGNEHAFAYDDIGRPSAQVVYGPVGGPGRTDRADRDSNVMLSQTMFVYDLLSAGNRTQVIERALAVVDGPDLVTSRDVDPAGRTVKVTRTDGAETLFEYDGAGRLTGEVDVLGNRTDYAYDAAGRVTTVTRTEHSAVAGFAPETFVERYRYDALGRVVVASAQGAAGPSDMSLADDQARHTRYGYDSRGNLTVAIDPEGRVTEHAYDGASRLLSSTEHLNAALTAITRQTLDGNGRLTQLVDANEHSTTFGYDDLDRLLKTTYPGDVDPNRNRWVYDAAGPRQFTNGNGAVFTFTHDALGRRTTMTATAAGGASAVSQAWEYDGLSRPTMLFDSDAAAAGLGDGKVHMTYNSLGRVTRESVDGLEVRYAQFENGAPPKRMTYPNQRELTCEYDAGYRLTSVGDTLEPGAEIAAWRFVGPHRVLDATLGNGLRCLFRNDGATRSAAQGTAQPWGAACDDRLGYDGAGRPIGKRYVGGAMPQIGPKLYMTRQRAAQNAGSWDFSRAHPWLPTTASPTAGYQHMAWQLGGDDTMTYDFVPAHPHVVPAPTEPPAAVQPAHQMIHQVVATNVAHVDWNRAPQLP